MQGNRWTQQPPAGQLIDWGVPLTEGLAFCAPLYEGAGTQPTELVTGLPLVFGGTPSWGAGGARASSGRGLICTTVSSGAHISPSPASLQISPPLTMVVALRWNGVAQTLSQGYPIFTLNTSSGGGQFGMRFTGFNINGSVNNSYSSTSPWHVAANTDITLGYGLSISGTTATELAYTNGIRNTTSGVLTTNGITAPAYTSTSMVSLGTPTFFGNACGATIYWAMAWYRLLSPAEYFAIAQNPWQIFRPKRAQAAIYQAYKVGLSAGLPAVPSGHAAPITIPLAGTGTTWTGGTTFTISGVTGVTKVSQSVTNGTRSKLVVTTGSGTGTLTISDGTFSTTVHVGAPGLTIAPGSTAQGTTGLLVATGTNTVWTQETASPLLSLASTLVGTSISGVAVHNDTTAFATLTTGVLPFGTSGGTATITDRSTGNTAPLAITPTVQPFNIGAWTTKCGKMIAFGATGLSPSGTGVFPHLAITGVAGAPSVAWNGSPAQIGDVAWFGQTHDAPFVACLAQFGAVQFVNFRSGGHGFVTPGTITVSAPGCTFGTPVLRSGVTSYTVTGGGTGYAPSPTITLTDPTGAGSGWTGYVVIQNGCPYSIVTQAGGSNYSLATTAAFSSGTATLTPIISGGVIQRFVITSLGTGNYPNPPAVTVPPPPGMVGMHGSTFARAISVVNPSGAVAFVLPLCGDIRGYGSGFTGTSVAITIAAPGSGTTATCTSVVSNYIATIPVVTGGSHSSPPAITVTDTAGGSGCLAVAVMSGAVKGDTLTYSAPAGWLTTSAGTTTWIGAGTPVGNNAGQLEAPANGILGFQVTPTMGCGINAGEQPTGIQINFAGKNRLLRSPAWQPNRGTTMAGFNSSNSPSFPYGVNPTTWTAGGSITGSAGGNLVSNQVDNTNLPEFTGIYHVQYTDPLAGTSGAHAIWMTGSAVTVTPVAPTGAPGTGCVLGAPVIASGRITSIPVVSGGTGYQGLALSIAATGAATTPLAVAIIGAGGVVQSIAMVNQGTNISAATVQSAPMLVSGTVVTSAWDFEYVANPSDVFVFPAFNMGNAAGRFDQVVGGVTTPTNPWVFAPGSTTDRSIPLAPDDTVVRNLTSPNGGTPTSVRFMDSCESFGGEGSFVNVPDLYPTAALKNWFGSPTSVVARFTTARFFNTNPAKGPAGDGTYAWVSTKLYLDQWFSDGTDPAFNNRPFITLPATDNGAFCGTGSGIQNTGIVEFVSTTPHGLTSGWHGNLFGNLQVPLTNGQAIDYTTATAGPPGYCWVTSATTVVIAVFNNKSTAPEGNFSQTVTGTAPVAISVTFTVTQQPVGGGYPYEFAGGFVRPLPGTSTHLNVPPLASDALITHIAAGIAAASGPTNGIDVEVGNEVWNGTFANKAVLSSPGVLGMLLSYRAPGGTSLGHYPNNGSVPSWSLSYATAHATDLVRAAWVAAGRDGSQVRCTVGSWWTGPTVTQDILADAARGNFSVNGLLVGAYHDLPGPSNFNNIPADATVSTAYLPVGTPGFDGGNWPVDALCDLLRHWFYYSPRIWGDFDAHANFIDAFTVAHPTLGNPRLQCYEGGVQVGMPQWMPGTLGTYLNHDMIMSPSYRDVIYGWYLGIQNGDPTHANSGCLRACYYEWFGLPASGSGNQWMISWGAQALPGLGAGNQYATPQGGLPSDMHSKYAVNVSPGMQGVQDFMQLSNGSPTPTPTPTRRWFSGLRLPPARMVR